MHMKHDVILTTKIAPESDLAVEGDDDDTVAGIPVGLSPLAGSVVVDTKLGRGLANGIIVGLNDGASLGATLPANVGTTDGFVLGLVDGVSVGVGVLTMVGTADPTVGYPVAAVGSTGVLLGASVRAGGARFCTRKLHNPGSVSTN